MKSSALALDFFSPYLNRFIQPDSIVPNPANPQSLNRFSYVYNNPIQYNDPTGHFAILPAIVLVAITAVLLTSCATSPGTSAPMSLTENQLIIQRHISLGDYEGAIDSSVSLYNLPIDRNKIRIGQPSNPNARAETTNQGEIILTNGAITNGAIDLVSTLAHESIHIDQLYNGRWYDDDTIGRSLNEVEAYDWVINHADKLELSPSVIEENRKERENNYSRLPASVQNNINNGIYKIDLPVLPTPSTRPKLIPV
jgi:hypothetical protein